MKNAKSTDSPRRLLHGIVSVLLVLISTFECGIADSGPSQNGVTIKVKVPLVTTDVMVVGDVVPNLRADDFMIADNGVTQTITHFSRDLNPIAVSLLIDRSYSTHPYLPALKIAALTALRRLHPEDQVALFTFDAYCKKLIDLTVDRRYIGMEISKITPGYLTNIYDSLSEAAIYLFKNAPNRRRAIILVSDNCQNAAAKHSPDSAILEMLESSVTLYGIRTRGEKCGHRKQVEQIAKETGGEILYAESATSIPAVLETAISNLRRQYTLGFSPSNADEGGSFHTLTVKIAKDRCPGCQILSRRGYYAGIKAPFSPPENQVFIPRELVTKTDQELVQRTILIAGTTGLDLTDISFRARASWKSGETASNGLLQLKIDLKIDPASIKFVAGKDGHAFSVHIAIFYFNEDGKPLRSDSKKLEGSLSKEVYSQVCKEGILFSTTIPLETKKPIVKAVVYDEKTDRVGSKVIALPEERN